MGFIYGIVNFDGAKAQLHDFDKLSGAMKSDGFDHQVFSGDFYSIGYCWNSQRGANAEIIKFRHLGIKHK